MDAWQGEKEERTWVDSIAWGIGRVSSGARTASARISEDEGVPRTGEGLRHQLNVASLALGEGFDKTSKFGDEE